MPKPEPGHGRGGRGGRGGGRGGRGRGRGGRGRGEKCGRGGDHRRANEVLGGEVIEELEHEIAVAHGLEGGRGDCGHGGRVRGGRGRGGRGRGHGGRGRGRRGREDEHEQVEEFVITHIPPHGRSLRRLDHPTSNVQYDSSNYPLAGVALVAGAALYAYKRAANKKSEDQSQSQLSIEHDVSENVA